MNKNEIFEKISKIIKKNYGREEVHINSKLTGTENSLDFESLEIVSLIADVENEFDLIIDFDVLFITVSDIVEEVIKLIN